jgi:hypothetical protein
MGAHSTMRLIGFLRTIALGAVILVVIIWAKGASAHHIAADVLRLELALLGVWTGWIILALLAWLCTGETRGSGKTGSAGPGSSNRLPVDWKSGQEVEPDLSSLFPPLRSTQLEEGPQTLVEENHLINDLSLVPCIPRRGSASRYSR